MRAENGYIILEENEANAIVTCCFCYFKECDTCPNKQVACTLRKLAGGNKNEATNSKRECKPSKDCY